MSIVSLSPQARQHIREHAQQCYPQECVGLLLGQSSGQGVSIEQIYRAENSAAQPHSHFLLDPHSYLQADRYAQAQGLEIVGIYHSHPDQPAYPSEHDVSGMRDAGKGWLYAIQSVYNGQSRELCVWRGGDLELRSCGE